MAPPWRPSSAAQRRFGAVQACRPLSALQDESGIQAYFKVIQGHP